MTAPTIIPRPVLVLAFPHAGASATCYQQLARVLPSSFRWVTHELPGRGTRLQEPLRRTMAALVDDVVERHQASFEQPYVLYGHSLGAWLVRDVAHKLRELGKRAPQCLFVSGRRGPSATSTTQPLHDLPPGTFRQRLATWGGTPPAVLNDPELMAFFEPILRADLEVLESCLPDRGAPLQVPIHVALGDQDDVTVEQARAWERETTGPVRVSTFRGGHFFIRDHAAGLAAIFEDALRKSPQARAP
jgi:medium-chain acyl-[acyl-carrier-protein] hydrolase